VLFFSEPQAPPWGGLRCFARDPDGYLIEIEQPGS
jgi:catechol 2,3-dioxygenase-like lactoylglutathione lyase family enzyme